MFWIQHQCFLLHSSLLCHLPCSVSPKLSHIYPYCCPQSWYHTPIPPLLPNTSFLHLQAAVRSHPNLRSSSPIFSAPVLPILYPSTPSQTTELYLRLKVDHGRPKFVGCLLFIPHVVSHPYPVPTSPSPVPHFLQRSLMSTHLMQLGPPALVLAPHQHFSFLNVQVGRRTRERKGEKERREKEKKEVRKEGKHGKEDL